MVSIHEKKVSGARKKARHRRTAGDAVIAVTLAKNLVRQIDRWRREHGTKTRSEAIRRLLAQALGTDPERRVTRKFAAAASELAGREIDRLADQSATSEEQAERKRRLIEGPQDLRTARRGSRN